ncbi:MAG: hypothetical protein ACRDL7_08160, partial [Gaiellaceae bacterium]
SVLVQNRDGDAPILDAEVLVELRSSAAEAIGSAATRQQATNKLLYAAAVTIPSAGPWTLRVAVRQGEATADVAGEIVVAAPLPPLLAHWPYVAFPPVAVVVFAIHQWLRSRSIKAS